jgi:hypothetical protein
VKLTESGGLFYEEARDDCAREPFNARVAKHEETRAVGYASMIWHYVRRFGKFQSATRVRIDLRDLSSGKQRTGR